MEDISSRVETKLRKLGLETYVMNPDLFVLFKRKASFLCMSHICHSRNFRKAEYQLSALGFLGSFG